MTCGNGRHGGWTILSQIVLPGIYWRGREGWRDFPHLSIWIPRATRKLCFFVCLACRRTIMTAENLRNMRITYISCCHMCRCSASPRITLSSSYRGTAHGGRFWICFTIQWVMPSTVKEELYSRALREKILNAWDAAPLAPTWILRRKRNRRAFEGVENVFVYVRSSIVSLFFFLVQYEVLFWIDD